MKVHLIMRGLLMMQVLSSTGQVNTEPCNRQSLVKSYLKKVPESFCLPQGMILYDVHNPQDIDGDGSAEMIIDYLNEELNYGDTILTGIYEMLPDSSYQAIKVFDNLRFPYYNDFNYSYFENKLEETGNQFLYNEYPGLWGLTGDTDYKLNFEGKMVKMSLNPGVGEYFYQEYEYEKKLNDWVLIKSTYKDEYAGNGELQTLEIPNPPPTLSDFNLLDYL